MELHPVERLQRRVAVPMSFSKWRRFPRLWGYKNEYWDGAARYTPNPSTVNLLLDVTAWSAPEPRYPFSIHKGVSVRTLTEPDWKKLPELFQYSFEEQLPLAGWGPRGARRAARAIIEWAKAGKDGSPIPDACCVAEETVAKEGGELTHAVGAALVTLVPAHRIDRLPEGAAIADPEDPSRHVVPHLDWIFVPRIYWRHGIATRLLAKIVSAFRESGRRYLASTCMTHNGISLVWHWRNGFQMLG